MDLDKLTEKEKVELKDFLLKRIPLFNKFDEELQSVEDFYLELFEILEEEIKDRLANDESISDEDLESIYIKELEFVKADLLERAIERFSEIQNNFQTAVL